MAGTGAHDSPDDALLQPAIALYAAGRFAEAEAAAEAVAAAHPAWARVRNLVGACAARQGRHADAADHYRAAIAIDPDYAGAMCNLAAALQATGALDEAARMCRRALSLDPNLVDAHATLGGLRRQLGDFEGAAASLAEAARLSPRDAARQSALGLALKELGRLAAAAEAFRSALAADPDHAPAHNGLGSALKGQGRLDAAADAFRAALRLRPEMDEARYNLGLTLEAAGRYAEAAEAYDAAGLRDSRERAALCLYRIDRLDEFRDRLHALEAGENASPLAASLSAHHASRSGEPDRYRFCPDPLTFVRHGRLAGLDEELRAALLDDIARADIEERTQKLLRGGVQSSGHLFRRGEPSFQRLADLVRAEIEAYRARLAGADCVFIERFPEDIDFNGAWYVKIRRGGELGAHIHEGGWLSGVVYLAMPEPRRGDEGDIAFGLHGGGYPGRREDFPETVLPVSAGEIALFPSSLFHRTLPFEADAERVCVSFDLAPPD